MNKLIVALAAISLLAGGYFYLGHKSTIHDDLTNISPLSNTNDKASSSILRYVPEDTLIFSGGLKPLDLKHIAQWTSVQLNNDYSQLLDDIETNQAAAPASQFLIEMYRLYLLNMTDVNMLNQTFGMGEQWDIAFYNVNAMPVIRYKLKEQDTFIQLVNRIEDKIQHQSSLKEVEGVSYRSYPFHQTAEATKTNLHLIVAQQDDYAVFTLDSQLDNTQDLYPALGLSLPDTSLANSPRLTQLIQEHGIQPDSISFIDTLNLVKGLTNPTSNSFGQMAKDLIQLTNPESAHHLTSIQSPACHKEIVETISSWPYLVAGYTQLSDMNMTMKLTAKINDPAFIESLKKLAGLIPQNYTKQSLPLYLSIGINSSYIASFFGSFQSKWASKELQCGALLEIQSSIKNIDAMGLAMVGMAQGLQGVGLALTQINDLTDLNTTNPNLANLPMIATITSDNSSNLVTIAGNFYPPLSNLDLTNLDGTTQNLKLPLIPAPLKVAIKEQQVTLFTGQSDYGFINASEQQQTQNFIQIGVDYTLLNQLSDKTKKINPNGSSNNPVAINNDSVNNQNTDSVETTLTDETAQLNQKRLYLNTSIGVSEQGLIIETEATL